MVVATGVDRPEHKPKDAIRERNLSRLLKLPHSVIVRAPSLLPMLYTVTELAQELGILAPTLREWLEHGMPQQRDARGHIWIDGRQFARWVTELRQARLARKMQPDEAYCLHCRKPVKLGDPVRKCQGKKVLLSGLCPECGNSINRGARIGKSD